MIDMVLVIAGSPRTLRDVVYGTVALGEKAYHGTDDDVRQRALTIETAGLVRDLAHELEQRGAADRRGWRWECKLLRSEREMPGALADRSWWAAWWPAVAGPGLVEPVAFPLG